MILASGGRIPPSCHLVMFTANQPVVHDNGLATHNVSIWVFSELSLTLNFNLNCLSDGQLACLCVDVCVDVQVYMCVGVCGWVCC